MIVNSLTPKSGDDRSNELNQSPRKGPVSSKSASPLLESLKPRGTKDFSFKKFDEVKKKPNNNGKYKFPGTDEKIWCRNLSLTFKLDSDKERKVDTAKRFNKSALQEGVNFCTDEDWHNYKSKANSDIILMSEFGAWIVFQLDKLGKQPSQSNGRKWRSAMISTLQHVMAMTIEIKPESSDMKRYVVRFYDPVTTEEYTRFASNNLNDLKKAHFFDAFSNHSSLAKSYDPQMMGLIEMITDPISDTRFSGKRPINYESAEPRFFFAMSSGVLHEIEQLSSDAKAGSLSKETLKSLFVKFPNNIGALREALLSGNEALILAYLKLATQADVDLKPLLMNVDGFGTLALCEALETSACSHMPSQARKQSEKALQTYMEFLRMVGITDHADIKKLLLNNSVLQSALKGGRPSTALNYVETLKKIGADSTDIKKLLLTKSGEGKTTFHRVMDHSPPPISAYLTMLAAADITDRADIQAQLLEEDSNGASVLSMALANGHDSAFPDLMQCIQYAQFSVDNMQLLLTGGTRRTCLRMLKHASPKAVQAYLDLVRTLISDFNDEDKNKVLKAVNDCANAIKLDPTFIDGKFDLKIDGLIASIKGISLDLQILQNFEIACKSKSLDAATKIIENIQLQPELFNIKITEEICTRFDRNDQCKLFCKIYKHIIRLSEIESDADRAKLFVSFLNSTKSLHPDDRHGLISAIVSNLDHYQPGKAITAEMDGLLDVIENFAGIQDEPKILKKMAHDISRSNHPVTIAEKILNLAGQLLDAERVAVIKAVARSGYYLKFDSKEMLRQKLKLAVESLTTEKQSEILAALDSHMD